jgi:hypothetical protein
MFVYPFDHEELLGAALAWFESPLWPLEFTAVTT